jgi:ribonuclease R
LSNSSAFSGRVSLNPRGFGFVTEEESAARPAPRSAFVTPPDLNPFLAGDLVHAEVTEAPDGRLTASKLTLVQRTGAPSTASPWRTVKPCFSRSTAR